MLKSLFITLILLSNNVLADKSDIIKGLSTYFTGITEQDISAMPFNGMYEVTLREPKLDVIYVSADGRSPSLVYLISQKKLCLPPPMLKKSSTRLTMKSM